jgi:hypothetical protein
MVHKRSKIIAEVEKNPTEKWFDMTKYLGLSPSTLNSAVAKKVEIVEQISKCRKSVRKRRQEETLYSASFRVYGWLVTRPCGHQVYVLMATSYM